MDVRWIISLVFIIQTSTSEDVLFESGKRFKTVDPATIEGGAALYEDPKNTGSSLFDSSADNNDKKRLTLNVMVNRFRSKDSKYFRAHPVFTSCLQQVLNKMQNDGTPVMIYSGYKTKSQTGSSTKLQDLYARAGTGAQLQFRPQVAGDIKNMAKAILKYCPSIFERVQRDVGVIMMSDRVHVHMTGADDTEPHFSTDGFAEMNTPTFALWARDAINEGLDQVQSPDCRKFSGLDSGATFPADVSTAEEVVGVVDQAVTRDTPEDYIRLVQYLGTNVDFANPNPSATWCATPGTPCVDCYTQPAGSHLSKRCANRLMTARMYNYLKTLQKLTTTNVAGSKLKVLKAFDEPYDGNTAYSETSLHSEGRQLSLQLDTANTEANLKTVTKYAQCLGVDYVKHNGDHIVLAVKKMKGNVVRKVFFPQGTELIVVQPPHDKLQDYKLPDGFSAAEEDLYPLFDSSGQEDLYLAENAPLSLFASKDSEFRYFRVDPRIPKCFSLILHSLNKLNADGDKATGVEVYQGFMTATEQKINIDPFDQRYNTFTLGTAMEVRYTDNPRNLSFAHLAQKAIDQCAPLFNENSEYIGIGLYRDRVFVDVRDELDVWTDDETFIPEEHSSIHAYRAELQTRYDAAVTFRTVDPDDWNQAKKSANVPYMQSPDYSHQPPPHVLRRRRSAPDPDDCVPKSDTPFCAKTKKHRENQVNLVWKEVNRKWHYHDKEEVRAALETCLGSCGTCVIGAHYEDKLESCDNFLHWIPFGLMNENTISNFFPRDNQELRKHACQGPCIEDAELFHLVINSVEAVFRPDPNMSVEEELYPQSENPSPLMKLLHQMYAIHATGVVKVWVQDDTDVSSLRESLQVLMLYNKNITRVEVYVSSPGSKDAVDATLENLKLEWSTTGYPPNTREFIAPFTLHDIPPLITKRDVDTSLREKLIEQHFNREYRWVRQEL